MFKKILVSLLALVMVMCASVTALATDFTSSVTAKEAPETMTATDASGKTVAAIIYDASGKEAASIPVGSLTVTPVSAAKSAVSAIGKQLTAAYEQLKTTALNTITPAIGNAVKDYSPSMTVDDLVVRDLFDVSLDEAAKQQLAKSGNSIKIRFALNLPSDALLLVLHNTEGTTWELIPDEKVVRNADGSVTVEFDSLSPIAFLTDGGSIAVDPNGPVSPQTGSESGSILLWGAVGVGTVALAALVIAIKKRTVN
ncbi:MAG: LPXTG cell wall anchor domain-containing protein [Oscillospiraceae bacterium]|nr:LPXTG cell wall anchor domain-containing protein [Oscillospiraceae bacterium]